LSDLVARQSNIAVLQRSQLATVAVPDRPAIASGAEGIDTNVGSFGTATFIITNNVLNNVPDNGITIDVDPRGTSELSATICNNILTAITQRGIDIEAVGSAKLTLLVDSNNITNIAAGSNYDFLRLRVGSTPSVLSTTNPTHTSVVNAIIRGNTGIRATTFSTNNLSTLCLQLKNNTFVGTSSFARNGSSTFNLEDTLGTNSPAIATPGATTIVSEGTCSAP
jgi:hypothetical protein